MTAPTKEIVVSVEHHDAMLGGLHNLKSLLIDAKDTTDRLIERSIGISPPSSTVPLTKPGGGTTTLKVLLLFGVSSLFCTVLGAHYSENNNMAKSKTASSTFTGKELNDARKTMVSGDYAGAVTLYELAYTHHLNPEECLFRMGECKFRLKDYEAAGKLADDLDRVSAGKNHYALLLRGWIAQAQGDLPTAKCWYQRAELAGNPDAGTLSRRIK